MTEQLDLELSRLLSVGSYHQASRSERDICSLWTTQHEETLDEWKANCIQQHSQHFYLGYFYWYLYIILSLPVIVLPAVCSQLNKLASADYVDVVEILLLISTVCAGILSVLNLGRRSQHHLSVQQTLYKFIQEIDLELRKPVPGRQPSEHFLVVMMYKIDGILSDAPGNGCVTTITAFLNCCWRNPYQQRRGPSAE